MWYRFDLTRFRIDLSVCIVIYIYSYIYIRTIYLDCSFTFMCKFTLNKITLPAHREMDSFFLSNWAVYDCAEVFPCIHTEKSFRSLIKSTRNQIVFTIFRMILNQTNVRLVPNQSENGKYNLVSGWFNNIVKRFLCVYGCAEVVPGSPQPTIIRLFRKQGNVFSAIRFSFVWQETWITLSVSKSNSLSLLQDFRFSCRIKLNN